MIIYAVLHCTVLSCVVLVWCCVIHCIMSCCIILCDIILCCIVLWFTVLYTIVLSCTMLYYMYCVILHLCVFSIAFSRNAVLQKIVGGCSVCINHVSILMHLYMYIYRRIYVHISCAIGFLYRVHTMSYHVTFVWVKSVCILYKYRTVQIE